MHFIITSFLFHQVFIFTHIYSIHFFLRVSYALLTVQHTSCTGHLDIICANH